MIKTQYLSKYIIYLLIYQIPLLGIEYWQKKFEASLHFGGENLSSVYFPATTTNLPSSTFFYGKLHLHLPIKYQKQRPPSITYQVHSVRSLFHISLEYTSNFKLYSGRNMGFIFVDHTNYKWCNRPFHISTEERDVSQKLKVRFNLKLGLFFPCQLYLKHSKFVLWFV